MSLISILCIVGILEDLVNSKRLAGSISGGRQEKATYVPDIYTLYCRYIGRPSEQQAPSR